MVRERLSHGLVFDANYTWMKAITDTTTLRSGWITQKTQTTTPVGALNVSLSYQLPFGKGQKLFAGNPIVRAVTSH